MSVTVDNGDQVVSIAYQQARTSENVNKLLRHAVDQGIATGLTVTNPSGNNLSISVGTLYIQSGTELLVRIQTTDVASVVVPPATYSDVNPAYLIASFNWVASTGRYAEFTTIAQSAVTGNELIIAGITFDSSGNVTGLDNDVRDSVANLELTGKKKDLTTTAKNTLVAAINEHDTEIGDVSSLTTTATNLSSAINEHETQINTNNAKIAKWSRYTIEATDFTASANTETIDLFTLPALTEIQKIIIKHTTAFSGGTSTAFTVEVGITGETDRYASAFDVFQTVANDTFLNSTMSFIENFASTTAVKITANSTGDTLDNISIGSVDIYVLTKTVDIT